MTTKNIFFIITSNPNSDNNIKLIYNFEESGIVNLKKVLSKTILNNNLNYKLCIYNISFEPKKVKERDKITKKYITNFKFNYNGKQYSKELLIDIRRNNFIYNFKLRENQNSNIDECIQFKIYKEALNTLNLKSEDIMSLDLLNDSKNILIEKDNKYLEFYLELLNYYYNTKEINNLLKMFNQEMSFNCKEINYEYYGNILDNIVNNIDSNKGLKSERQKEESFENFVNLLLIYRSKYEIKKFQEMLNQKSLWEYFSQNLIQNIKYYLNLNIIIPKGLINKMLSQNKLLSIEKIRKILSLSESIEDLLILINNNCNSIYQNCKKKNYKFEIIEFQKQKETDNLIIIMKELEKLVNYELKQNFQFISLGEDFWSNYLNYYKSVEDFKNLILMEQSILICKRIDKNLNIEKFSQIIHDSEYKIINNGELKNEKLLDFFENNYIKPIKNSNNEMKINFPFFFLNGIDLDTAKDNFYNKWNELNILSFINNNEKDFIQNLINKITKMENYEKIFKLLENKKEIIIKENIILILKEKYSELIKNYESNKCINFIEDSLKLIYLIDRNKQNIINFLENVVIKYTKNIEDIINIFSYLLSDYEDISNNLKFYIIIYFIKNKNKLNSKDLTILKSQLKIKSIVELIFNEINKNVINEEEFFNEDKNIDFFIILKSVQEEIDCNEFINSKFLSNITKLKNTILNNIKKGEIKYDLISSWLNDKEKKYLLKERLNILCFNYENEVNECIESYYYYCNKINETINYLQKLSNVLKKFFPIEQQKGIKYIEDLEKEIKTGQLNEVDKKKEQLNIDRYILKDLDLDEMDKLKSSIFFFNLFNKKKLNKSNLNEMETFKITKTDFMKLKLLFNNNWIENKIINEYSDIIKKIDEKELEKELNLLKEYFSLNYIDESYLLKLKEDIILFIQKKEEILQMINNCFLFISEFVTNKTEFFYELKNIYKKYQKKITLELIKNYEKILEKYFSNKFDAKQGDENSHTFQKIKILNNQNKILSQEVNNLREQNNIFQSKINELTDEFNKEKEKEKITDEKSNSFSWFVEQYKILSEKLSRYPIDLLKDEKMISVIFTNSYKQFYISIICKNTELFSSVENKFYGKIEEIFDNNNRFSKYKETENYFILNNKKIIKSKRLDENDIKDNNIIIIRQFSNG